MTSYRVRWEMDIDEVDSEYAAAEKALEYQRSPGSEATVFEVIREVNGHPTVGAWTTVDLTERTVNGAPLNSEPAEEDWLRIDCPTCGEPAGLLCVWMTHGPDHEKDDQRATPHPQRAREATMPAVQVEVVDLVAALRGSVEAAKKRRLISGYVAKLAAETVLGEPGYEADLTDAGIRAALSGCVRPPADDEIPAIREAFVKEHQR